MKTIVFVVLAIASPVLAYKTYVKIKRKLRAMDINGKERDINKTTENG